MRRALLVLLMTATTVSAAGSPELLVAVRQGDHFAAQELLEAGADVNTADSDGTTALMHAVIESDATMMKRLMDHGANVNAKNALDSTALMYAAADLEKTRLLLNAGAEVNVKNERGDTPMTVAVSTFGSTPVLKLLRARGAEADNRMMTSAAQRGDFEAMQYLLSIGVSPGGSDSGPIFAALGARCDACVRLLLDKGAPVAGGSARSVLGQTSKRAMPEMSQLLLGHGASLTAKDPEGFTLLQQAVLSMEESGSRDRMVQWLLTNGVNPNETNDRGQTAYQLAARVGAVRVMELLKKAGAKEVIDDEWPKPTGAPTAQAAVEKVLPLIETSGEAVFKKRGCISCHHNSLPAMTVALARKKGLVVNDEQAKKELGFAIALQTPSVERMRLGLASGGGAATLGYTMMGMAAAGHPAGALTDAQVHYLAVEQYPDGAWRKTTAYRPPSEYSSITVTAVSLRAIRSYPILGRRAEFEQRFARAKNWLLSTKAYSGEEQSMQLIGLEAAGASAAERAPFVRALKAAQNPDGSWSQLPESRGDAYATGQALYALHTSGDVPTSDRVYEKGVQWLLRNQLSDGSWFVTARTAPIQPYFESGFPHGEHQWISDGGSCWASMALLFTLPDSLKTQGEVRTAFPGDSSH